jgi:hypothetical protein
MACTCGHAIEDHGNDVDYNSSTACDLCGCIAYEEDRNEPEPLRCEEVGHARPA